LLGLFVVVGSVGHSVEPVGLGVGEGYVDLLVVVDPLGVDVLAVGYVEGYVDLLVVYQSVVGLGL